MAALAPAERQASNGHRHAAEELITACVVELESLYAADPNNPHYAAGLALLHLRWGDILARVAPAEQARGHLQRAVGLHEPVAQQPLPLQPSPFYEWASTQDALAECRVRLHRENCSDEHDKMLFPVLEYLSTETEQPLREEVVVWREKLSAEAERSLGFRLVHRRRYADAELHLRNSLARYDRLMADYPADIEFLPRLRRLRVVPDGDARRHHRRSGPTNRPGGWPIATTHIPPR